MNNKLALAATKAGMILLESGAEAYRVEDTMKRICFAYGANTVDSYATPTMLLISFSVNGELFHNVKRTHIKSVDLNKIDKVNALSRQIANEQMPIDEFMECLDKIEHEKVYDDAVKVLAAAVSIFGFALFYGGNYKDAICALLLGAVVKNVTIQIDKIEFSAFFKNIFCSAFATIASVMFSKLGLCDSVDIVIISVFMLLVPGLAFTNAIRDTVSGDLISGLTRTVEAIFVAIALALGSGIVFWMIGGF